MNNKSTSSVHSLQRDQLYGLTHMFMSCLLNSGLHACSLETYAGNKDG